MERLLSLILLLFLTGNPTRQVIVKGGTFRTTDPQNGQQLTVKTGDLEVDKYLVTVAEFERFTRETGYITMAERFGNSIIFDFKDGQWKLCDGADFRHPFGPQQPKAASDHPVTQVSWYDAVAYCQWRGRRLPTDAEWEYIARNGGRSDHPYPWGNSDYEDGRYLVNSWQGSFPYYNTAADGFPATSPAGYFGEDLTGLTDMGGNVWQWCQDSVQPAGCNAEDDLSVRKVCRGGSFLCDKTVCHGYKIGNRTSSTPESGMVHIGFRTVRDL